jgi:DNA-binding protein H-NS
MAVNLDSLNIKQLNDVIARAQARIEFLNGEKASKARAKLATLAKAEGFTLEELFGAKRGRKAKGKVKRVVKAKYRNPANPSETWAGRGKRPRWFNAALKAGKKENDLLIK